MFKWVGPIPPASTPHATAQPPGPATLDGLAGRLSDAESRIVYGHFAPIPVQYGNDIWGPYVVTPGGGNLPDLPSNPSTPVVPPDRRVPEPATLAIMAPPLVVLFALAALRSGGGRPLPVRSSARLNAAGS